MSRDERTYLLDMLTAARRALEHARGLTRESFGESTLHQDAIIRNIEIIGEAAGNVGEAAQAAHPEIPWAEITGMRNRLIHEYFGVNLDRVWEVVERDLPDLVRKLASLVPSEPASA
jgi:uncharacterized protein with HEPN domain